MAALSAKVGDLDDVRAIMATLKEVRDLCCSQSRRLALRKPPAQEMYLQGMRAIMAVLKEVRGALASA
jgi:hypothetical protein